METDDIGHFRLGKQKDFEQKITRWGSDFRSGGCFRSALGQFLAGILIVYFCFPFVAGIFKFYDRRGPKIYFAAHHELFYRFGYSFVSNEKPRVPFNRQRSWFYGMKGEAVS